MLILTRKPGETIVIGDATVTITILGVRGNQVRLGVEAPLEISVHREEIYNRIQKEKMRQRTQIEEIIVETEGGEGGNVGGIMSEGVVTTDTVQ